MTIRTIIVAVIASLSFAGTGLGEVTSMFTNSGQALGNSESFSVALGDLNGDGHLDAVVANTNHPSTVWTNNGHGIFTDSGQALGTDVASNSVALGDLNGDGHLDAWFANINFEGSTVWINDGSGTFADSGQALGTDVASTSVALGDLDGDGDLDAIVANKGVPNTVWTNDGNGTFTNSGQTLGNSDSFSVALGDLDGDGHLDAWVANLDQPNTVWTNDGNGTFTNSGQALGNSGSLSVALGDLDGDGHLDAMVGNDKADTKGAPNTVWTNNGNGIFTNSGQALGNGRSWSVALGDFNGDGHLDAMAGNLGNFGDDPFNTVWTNDGNGTFTNSGQALGNRNSYSVALGDLDGDGHLDAMVGNGIGANNAANTVWINVIQGACCVEGVCLQLQADFCASTGGSYLGGNCSDTTCAEPTATGACCASSGCSIVTEDQCTGFGGTWTEGGSCDDCPPSCSSDSDNDGDVDIYDLLFVIEVWGVCP